MELDLNLPRTIQEFCQWWELQPSSFRRTYVDFRQSSNDSDQARAWLDSMWLQPRILCEVGVPDTRQHLYGREFALPVIVAPTAVHALIERTGIHGEVATVNAAMNAGAGYCYNVILANKSLEDIEEAARAQMRGTQGSLWMHLYVVDRDIVAAALERANRNQDIYSAVIVTCDHPHTRVADIMVPRYRQYSATTAEPVPSPFYPNHNILVQQDSTTNQAKSDVEQSSDRIDNPNLGWADIDWIRSQTSLPIIIKGVLCVQDARLAVDHGASGIVVSNHGGRQLGGEVPSLAVLEEIVDEVGSEIDVFVDSGLRSSSDILKALAIGAKAVLLGRPTLWALAHGGEESLHRMLTTLRSEIVADMQSLGCKSLRDIGRHHIYKGRGRCSSA